MLIALVLTVFCSASLAGPRLAANLSESRVRTAQTETPPAGKKKAKNKKDKKAKAEKPAPDEVIDDADGNSAQPDEPKGGRFVWRQHPSLRYGRNVRIDFEAKFQEDVHASYAGAPLADTFELHRNRVGIQGNLFRHIDFEIERELTEKEVDVGRTPKSPWKDVYANVDYIHNAQVQVGKFKVPFGLDQLTGVTHNDFVYRSLGAIYLAPARDIGVMVHGRFFKRGLNYWTGVFRHDGDNARSSKIQGGDETFALRVTGLPFRKAAARPAGKVEVGGSWTISALSDDSFRPNGLRGRTLLTQDTFFAPVYVKGRRQRWEADVDWTAGPSSVRSEYTHVADQRLNQGFADVNLPDARYRAWYVSGTCLLTGEEKDRPVNPDRDFLNGGFGAVELAVRYERIWFDSVNGTDEPFANPRAENILPTGDRALTLGVNWTLNRFIKLQFNAIREHVEDPERSPVPNGAPFWSRVMRLQFVL